MLGFFGVPLSPPRARRRLGEVPFRVEGSGGIAPLMAGGRDPQFIRPYEAPGIGYIQPDEQHAVGPALSCDRSQRQGKSLAVLVVAGEATLYSHRFMGLDVAVLKDELCRRIPDQG